MIHPDQLADLRAETPGINQRIHLNNAGAALMPQPVAATIHQHLELETQIGGYEAAALKIEEIQQFYQSVARLINADARQIAYTSSATDSYNQALSSIEFEPGDVLLTTINDYASNQIAFIQLAKRFNVQILRAKDTPDGGVDLSSMETMIKRHRPKLVALTHIPTNSGLVQPAAAVGALCKEYDILYLLDACQSAGQMPLDVKALHCDFLSATFRKYLRGPRGAGFLYISDRVLQSKMEPLFLDMLSATWKQPNQYQSVDNGKRFELWEKPYALVLGSKAAVDYALNIGLGPISDRVLSLAAYGRKKLAEIPGLRLLDEGAQLCGIITFHLAHQAAETLKKQLQQHGINTSIATLEAALIDFQNKGVTAALRVSPHYYNTFAELDTLVEKIKAISHHGSSASN